MTEKRALITPPLLHNFVQQVLSRQLLPGSRETRRMQLQITALVLCTYSTWSCKTGGTPVTWCMLTSRCPRIQTAGNAGSSNVAYLLSQGRSFAQPTWFGDRLTKEVKKWASKLFSMPLLAEDEILQCFRFLAKLCTHKAEHLQSWSTGLL